MAKKKPKTDAPSLRGVSSTEFLEKTGEYLKGHARTAWKPVVKKGDGPAAASKFGGVAWLDTREEWPACGQCSHPMHLLVQFHFDELPAEIGRQHGTGLFQFFYCTNDEEWQTSGDHYSDCFLLRAVQPDSSKRKPTVPKFNDDYPEPFPAKRITGWKEVPDFPCITEFPLLGVKHEVIPGQKTLRLKVVNESLGIASEVDYVEFRKLDQCVTGDKLGGWPSWVQVNSDYPDCPDCQLKLQSPLFTISYRDNIPYDFADGGRGHVFRCPKHSDRFAFPWQCG